MANYFSVSDMSTFLSCRFKWDLSSPNRKSYRHKATPRMYLWQGTALHHAIEATPAGRDPLEAAEEYLSDEHTRQVEAYIAANGTKPWPMEMAKFDTVAEETLDLVRQYVDRYGIENPLSEQGLTYVATEVPFKIDISDLLGVPDSYFVGTFDAIAVDDQDNFFLVENKTYSSRPDIADLMFHNQNTGYAVAWWMLTNTQLTGILYNGITKRLMSEPKILKNGLLSTDKRVATTYDKYVEAIRANGESPDDSRFQDVLQHLRSIREDDDRFFYREMFYFNVAQIENWWLDFLKIAREMISDPAIYRTIPYNGCGPRGQDCWYRDLCTTIHSGGDMQYILDKRYETSAYGTIEEVNGIEPHMISSVEDLKETLKRGI